MIYVGVDCGKFNIYTAILLENSSLYELHGFGVANKNDIDRTYSFFNYLRDFFGGLKEKWGEDNIVVSIEGPIYMQNIKTTTDIHRNIVVTELAASECGIPSFQYDNRTWKKGVIGNGKASKDDISKFFDVRWKDSECSSSVLSQDEKDASCIALHQYILMSKGK